MKPLKKYWSETPEEQEETSVGQRYEQIELQAKQAVMRAKHEAVQAKNERDAYIKGIKNTTGECFSKILCHCKNVAAKNENHKQAEEVANALFNNQTEENAS